MEISVRLLGGVDVFDVSGRPSLDGHRRLRSSFQHAIERGRKVFILNLSHASSLDSMTLGEMVACLKRARERGGDVKLVVTPGGVVHELVQLTGLDRVLEVFGDEAEAAASLTSPGALS